MQAFWLMGLTRRKSSPEPVVERVGNYPPPKTGAEDDEWLNERDYTMFETYWIYTNDGVKVGKFEVSIISMISSFMTEDEFVTFKFRQACERQNLDRNAHNFCIAAE